MPTRRPSVHPTRTVQQQIRTLLIILSVTMATIITVLTLMLVAINRQYAGVLAGV